MSRQLLEIEPQGGHGKVWNRVLSALNQRAHLVPIDPGGRWRSRLRQVEYDVVLADGHDELPDSRRAPLVVQVHEAAWFRPELRAVLDQRFVDHIAPLTLRAISSADRVITPSQSARADVIHDYELAADRVVAVHHGVDEGFNPSVDLGEARTPADDRPYVLFAAMIHPRKNLATVRDAVDRLVTEGLPHQLVIVGGPASDRPDSSELEAAATSELSSARGRITRVHSPSDRELAALMAGADVFCLPSLYEGFGLTVLEAMACGTAVVVSDRGSLPEVVGDAGLVVEPKVDAVADALRMLVSSPDRRSRLGRAAAERARGFTWAATAEGWLRVLRDVAEGRRGASGPA